VPARQKRPAAGDEPGGIVPVAVLVMDVTGPGKLDIVGRYGQNPVALRRGC